MKRLAAALALIATGDAGAAELSDNPAFCFGYLSAKTPALYRQLAPKETAIRTRFARAGPKDSTDERDFDDWRRFGAQTALAERSDTRTAACAKLLDGSKRQ